MALIYCSHGARRPNGADDMATVSDSMVYLTDNGAALCGAHLGFTAKTTGRDVSGQAIMPLTPDAVAECERAYGYTPSCEQCGRKPSTLHLVTTAGH